MRQERQGQYFLETNRPPVAGVGTLNDTNKEGLDL